MACLCALTSLEEATIGYHYWGREDDPDAVQQLQAWVPPVPGLCSLQRLTLNECVRMCHALAC